MVLHLKIIIYDNKKTFKRTLKLFSITFLFLFTSCTAKVDVSETIKEDKVDLNINNIIEEHTLINEKSSFDSSIIYKKLKEYDYSNNNEKIVFLTFDDGPSITNTPKVLEILSKNNIQATFFIKGNQLEKEQSQQILKDIYINGHSIGNHSYTHNYDKLYPNKVLDLNSFVDEIVKTDKKISDVLGIPFKSKVLRCPGGSMSWRKMEPLYDYLKNNNMYSIDWNALVKDSEGKPKTSAEIFKYAKETSSKKDIVVLLMHDTYGKENTVAALQNIIDFYKKENYEFKTLN